MNGSVTAAEVPSGPGSAHHGLLEVVGFDAADEERLTHGQGLHEGIQGLTELAGQSRNALLAVGGLL